MRNATVFILIMVMQCLSGSVFAQPLTVKSMRFWSQPNEARMVFDVTEPSVQEISLLHNPTRLVVNIENAKLHHKIKQPASNNPFLAGIYSTEKHGKRLQIILELKKNVSFKHFVLKPNKTYGHRLVIDVFDASAASAPLVNGESAGPVQLARQASNRDSAINATPKSEYKPKRVDTEKSKAIITASKQPNNTASTQQTAAKVKTIPKPKPSITAKAIPVTKEIVVAIDAGHGGEDSGAIGPSGTAEKEVVFQIAKKLEALIAKQPGMSPVMVRESDYYIKLRKRMQIARSAKADLFVSIHADAYTNSNAMGASVFTLSHRGASSEAARWLANNENAADLIGGVSLDDKDDMLASVLLDLSQTATTEASSNIAKRVLSNVKRINPLHKTSVQKAGFAVLKSPDIPSILVETAFISNPKEEQKLRNTAHQYKVARAIFKGIVAYFRHDVPFATPLRVAKASKKASKSEAVTKHSVTPGETLSGIAKQYGVTMREIKSVNTMNSGLVKVGQVLRIPVDS